MYELKLEPQEREALLIFLSRTDIKGGEAKTMAILQMKIEQAPIVKEPTPEPLMKDVKKPHCDQAESLEKAIENSKCEVKVTKIDCNEY